jgi:hypothetical protein
MPSASCIRPATQPYFQPRIDKCVERTTDGFGRRVLRQKRRDLVRQDYLWSGPSKIERCQQLNLKFGMQDIFRHAHFLERIVAIIDRFEVNKQEVLESPFHVYEPPRLSARKMAARHRDAASAAKCTLSVPLHWIPTANVVTGSIPAGQ